MDAEGPKGRNLKPNEDEQKRPVAPRIRDVARLAQVSTATVSRALAEPERVSPQARERVLAAVTQTGYHPNLAARSLRQQKTRMILVVLPDLANIFFSKILQGIEEKLFSAGYGMIIGNLDGSPEKEGRFAAFLATAQVDGALLLNGHLVGQSRHGEGRPTPTSVPLVALCEAIPGAGVPAIGVDNRAAARRMVLYLAGQGHRRIAYVAGPPGNVLEKERFSGYKEGLAEAGIGFDPVLALPGDYKLETGALAGERILALARRPSAIFCSNDEMAIGLLGTLAARGVRVPQEISVAGFDDIEFAAMAQPALTTIRQPRYELGRVGAEALLARIAGRPTTSQVLPTELIVRQSTRAL